MTRIIMLVVMAAFYALAASAEQGLPSFIPYQAEDGSFRAQIPTDWARSARTPPYADMTTVAGAEFAGPTAADGVPPTIALHHYSGEGAFVTPDSYVNARLGSMVREDAERGRNTSEMRMAGRNAIVFPMKTFELIMRPPDDPIAGKEGDPRVYEIAPVTKKVLMEEQYVVLPAAKGYFVLHYRAPEGVADRYRPLFEKVVASFQPLVP